MKTCTFQRKELALAVASLVAVSAASTAGAQNADAPAAPRPVAPAIEEIVVTSRLKDSATEILVERLEQPFSAEVLGVDQMVRVGDSDVAAALRRVTGLSLVDGQYIYVRGLGERYSSTTLNGAHVPSPELSRNVIPLDLFPTSILHSVKIHKAYSPDQPAAFGGGNVDIRTRGLPSGPVFNLSFGTGWNSENSGKGLSTLGDNGDLPRPIANAIHQYEGNLEANNIARFTGDLNSAAAVNRDLMLSLDRNIDIKETKLDPDMSGSISLGNSWLLGQDWEVGVLASVDQKTQIRNKNQVDRNFNDPVQDYDRVYRTVEEKGLTGALNLGINYRDKHLLRTNSYLLLNEEDQSSIVLGHNADFLARDGRQRKTSMARMEDREFQVHQIVGEHRIDKTDLGFAWMPAYISGINVNWIYSESNASTSVPNATSVQATNRYDTDTGALLSSQINAGNSIQFNFLELDDEVSSGGFNLEVPFEFASVYGSLTGGYLDTSKTREYYGYTVNIGASPISPRSGTVGEVLSNDRLADPANGFRLSLGSNFGTESYVAAETVEAIYGGFDIVFNDTWRFTGGVRWEEFMRGFLPVNLLDYSGQSINQLIEALQNPNQTFAVQEDDYYPSLAVTYIRDGFLGADNFQLRLGYGKTVVRPDLREVSDVMFIDPELNIRVQGNPSLRFAEIDHIDLRGELFYNDGSNLTASLFYKDIANPIEQIELPGPQDARLFGYTNASRGSVYGLELEGLKPLPWGFFLVGNLVLSDSDIDFGSSSSQTNSSRRLTGHSEYVVNAQLGWDSDDGKHSVSAVYNVFGDRVYFGGRTPSPDGYEQPFHSLDLVYSFYPMEQASVKLKVQNLLNEKREFTQGSVTVLEEEVGTTVGLDFKWTF